MLVKITAPTSSLKMNIFFVLSVICIAILSISHAKHVTPNVYQEVPSSYIVNGEKAERHQFPYQATILRKIPFWGGYRYMPFCGATVISESYLLTAAHCSLGLDLQRDVKDLKVVIGVHKLNHEDRVISNVEKFIPHERFSMSPVVNDIGLIKLQTPLDFSSGIKAAKLPSLGQLFTGHAVTSGHGLINPRYQDSISEHLLWLDVKIQPDTVCTRQWIYKFSQTRFTPGMMICATAEDGKSPCMGDSGGPLVQNLENGDNVIVGAVSFGPRNCGEIGVPFVFTKVSAYRNWIREQSGI